MIEAIVLVFSVVLMYVIFPTKVHVLNKFYVFVISVILICLAAFRTPGSDRDYFIYEKYYWGDSSFTDVEYSFILLRLVLKDYLNLTVISAFVVYAILGVTLKIKGIKSLSTIVSLSLLIYVSNYYMLHELTQIRAGVATALFLISIVYIFERNLKLFLFFVIIAGFFHYSAFMALPLWFVKPYSRNLKYYTILIVIGFAFLLLKIDLIADVPIPYVQNRIKIYILLTESAEDHEGAVDFLNPRFFFKMAIFFVLLLFRHKIAPKNKYFYLLLKIYAISLFVFMTFSKIPALSYRMQTFFGTVDIILIPMLAYIFKNKFLGYILVIAIAIAFLLYNLIISELIINP